MLSKIKDFFKGDTSNIGVDKDGQASDQDMQAACGVLLLELAGIDGDYAPEEVETIFSLMEKQFGINTEQSQELLEIADALREQAPGDGARKIDEFVSTINSSFNATQKQTILSMVWQVVVADGKIEKFEARFANQLKSRFQLSDEAAEAARRTAIS